MKNTPKVLFLARWYPDRYDPMTGLFIKRHAEVATELTDVAVLYLRAAPDKPCGYEIEQHADNNLKTIIVYYGTKSKLPAFIMKPFAGFMFIMAFVKGYSSLLKTWGKPGIIHVNVLTRLGLFALWLKWFGGVKYVITEHWSRYLPVTGTFKGWLRKITTKLVVKNAAAVSTVSENLAEAMQQHGLHNRNYMVLPNVVDMDAFFPLAAEADREVKRLIHISCFEDRSKNISGLLRSLSLLSKQRDDFECIMVGEGIDLGKMKTLATNLGLKEPQLTFTGLLENEKLIAAYQSADFMVMFSNYENMPVVISESLACGLPVVATSVGGIPEYITNENGILVPPGDENALVDALVFMLDHYHVFDPGHLRQTAVHNFGKQAVIDKLKELYGFAAS